MPKVFIAYSSQNTIHVVRLVHKLEQTGRIRVWFARRDMGATESWEDSASRLTGAIRSCPIFLFCASRYTCGEYEGSLMSKEIEVAIARAKADPSFRVIPVSLDGAAPPKIFSTYRAFLLDSPETIGELIETILE